MNNRANLQQIERMNKFRGRVFTAEERAERFKVVVEIGQRMIYRHFKGNYYVAFLVSTSCEDATQQNVLYTSVDNIQDLKTFKLKPNAVIWSRPIDNFFSFCDFEKYPQCESLYRQSNIQELLADGWSKEDLKNDILMKNYDEEITDLLTKLVEITEEPKEKIYGWQL